MHKRPAVSVEQFEGKPGMFDHNSFLVGNIDAAPPQHPDHDYLQNPTLGSLDDFAFASHGSYDPSFNAGLDFELGDWIHQDGLDAAITSGNGTGAA